MRTLRLIFAVFFLGVSSSTLIFADQGLHDIVPEVASETSSSTQTDTSSSQPKEVQSYKLEDSAKGPSLPQAKAPLNSPKEQKSERVSRHFSSTKSFQPPKSVFFQTNIGVGFLYFSGLRANLMGQPVNNFDPPGSAWRDAPLKGRLSYNTTPLFEYLLGYRFNSWLKLAFSYQHQAGITIQSKTVSAFTNQGGPRFSAFIKFSSNLSLNALLAKVYLELPFAMVWRSLSINPYLAIGVGPGSQSWTQIQTYNMEGNTFFSSEVLYLQQKTSFNPVWMTDLGFQMQKVASTNQFSMVMGCKYNQWGQARNIGQMSKQGAHKLALTQPFRIRTVYQFAPYLGFQWNFLPNLSAGPTYKLKGKNPKVWFPYWVASSEFQCPSSIWTQFNAGVGFLYFGGLRGNLMGQPVLNFAPATSWRDAPFKGHLSYNRTPLFEYLLGYQFNSWLKLAFSYQHQGGVAIQSKALSAFSPQGRLLGDSVFAQLSSSLSLDALLAKVYFELPFAMIWRNLQLFPLE